MRSKEIELCKNSLSLSELQKEVLIGVLLGDGHLETKNQGRTYRLKIEQSIRRDEYVTHLFEVFRNWVRTAPKIKKKERLGISSENVFFQTLSHGSFRFFAQQFYAGRKKRVPELIHRWLTPRALAYWYMDDGSIKSKESKGVILNTHGFEATEIERLIEVLNERFKLNASLRKQRDGFQIYISGKSYETFAEVVNPFIVESMKYKIPPARLTKCPKSNGGAQW